MIFSFEGVLIKSALPNLCLIYFWISKYSKLAFEPDFSILNNWLNLCVYEYEILIGYQAFCSKKQLLNVDIIGTCIKHIFQIIDIDGKIVLCNFYHYYRFSNCKREEKG